MNNALYELALQIFKINFERTVKREFNKTEAN